MCAGLGLGARKLLPSQLFSVGVAVQCPGLVVEYFLGVCVHKDQFMRLLVVFPAACRFPVEGWLSCLTPTLGSIHVELCGVLGQIRATCTAIP